MDTVEYIANYLMDMKFRHSVEEIIRATKPEAIALQKEDLDSLVHYNRLLAESKGVSKASYLTEEIEDAKQFCVDCMVSLGGGMQWATHHPDAKIREAGEFLEPEFNAFSHIHREATDVFIGGMIGLGEKFSTSALSSHIKTVGFMSVITPMVKKANDLSIMLQDRALEKTGMTVPEIEKAGALAIEKIIKRANANLVLNPSKEGDDFALKMNTLISERKTTVKKSKAHKTKEEKEKKEELTVEENIRTIKTDVQEIKEELL